VQIAGEETLNVSIITLSVKIDDEGDFFQVWVKLCKTYTNHFEFFFFLQLYILISSRKDYLVDLRILSVCVCMCVCVHTCVCVCTGEKEIHDNHIGINKKIQESGARSQHSLNWCKLLTIFYIFSEKIAPSVFPLVKKKKGILIFPIACSFWLLWRLF
jgi:hypothetical protein